MIRHYGLTEREAANSFTDDEMEMMAASGNNPQSNVCKEVLALRAELQSFGNSEQLEHVSAVCPKCGGRGTYHCPQALGTVECECNLESVSQLSTLRDGVEAIRNSDIAIDVGKIQVERDAGNSPVIPDGWVSVNERMPEREVDVQLYCADSNEQMVGYMERDESEDNFRFATWRTGHGIYCQPTHWMPLQAAPNEV